MNRLPKTLAALRECGDPHEAIGELLDTDPLAVRELLMQALDQLDRQPHGRR